MSAGTGIGGRAPQFLVRGLVLATSCSVLVVAFPVLETVQLALAGYLLGKLGQRVGMRRDAGLALGAACLLAGLALAWLLVTLAFSLGGRIDKTPGLRDTFLSPGLLLGAGLGFCLYLHQLRLGGPTAASAN